MASIALSNPMVYIFPIIWFVAYKLINNFWLWLLFVPISLVVIRTIRSWYFKEDVFDHSSEQYESGEVQLNLNRDEDMERMCSPIWKNTYTRTSYFPSLITHPHSCQPEVHFSENGKWKATTTHNKWRFIPGLKVENEFTVRCERV